MKIYINSVQHIKPTQITVGFIEVKYKKDKLSHLSQLALKRYLKEHPIPVVVGPKNQLYLIDKHHMAKALIELNIKNCYFTVQHNFSDIAEDKFFPVLEVLELIHPYDENGNKVDISLIPDSIKQLKDDPYRSLASFVKRNHGFIKVNKPYIEFLWADFLREHISKDEIQNNIEKATKKATTLCTSNKASHLLGYIHHNYSKKKA